MSTAIDMGRVVVKIKLTNYGDLHLQSLGLLKGEPRSIEVETLVDTGATRLSLKPSVIAALGLQRVEIVSSKTANGICKRGKYGPVQLELMGRSGNFDVMEVPEDVPNLLGQIPLEDLDFVVDPRNQRLIGNPEHGGEQMVEQYFGP
jgi:predicted aspartyl protease